MVEIATVNSFALGMLLEVDDGKTWDLSATTSYGICKVSTPLLRPLQCNYPFFQNGGLDGIFARPIFGIIVDDNLTVWVIYVSRVVSLIYILTKYSQG
jgi:hypothetical protein